MRLKCLFAPSILIALFAFATLAACARAPVTEQSATAPPLTAAPTTGGTAVPPTRPPITPPAIEPTSPPDAGASATAAATTVATNLSAPLLGYNWTERAHFAAGLVAGERYVLAELPGASYYQIDVTIDPSLTALDGRQAVHYTNRETVTLDALYFRLFPNLAAGRSTASNVRVNDVPVTPALELNGSALRVPLDPPLPPGGAIVVEMAFAVEVPDQQGGNYGEFIFDDDVLALAHFYPMIAVYDDEGWNVEIAPSSGDVVYADASFYVVRVVAPDDLVVVASGVELAREPASGGTAYRFAAGPARDFYLAGSRRYDVVSGRVGETAVHSYAFPEHAAAARVALDVTLAAVALFEERFGPYPYTELELVSTPTRALGIEYPGVFVNTSAMYDLDATLGGTPARVFLESTTAHEVAHQWFYNTVGNDQLDEPWLDEALAQYATWLYYRDVVGPEAADGYLRSFEARWSGAGRSEIPIGQPVAAYSASEYGAIVYGRGPLFLLALAEQMGEPVFLSFLSDYYAKHTWGIATTERFRALAETHCGCDLGPLFAAWVDAN